jgi:hypothetical protein
MKTKIAFITLGVIALCVVGFRYVSTKQVAPSLSNEISTAGWKTYTNKLMKIEIKYPSDYTVYQRTEGEKLLLADEDSQGFNIIKTERIPHLFCCEPSILTFDGVYHPGDKFPGYNQVIINGKKAWQLYGTGAMDNPYRLVVIRDGSYTINIYENFGDEVFEKIIESMVFLK